MYSINTLNHAHIFSPVSRCLDQRIKLKKMVCYIIIISPAVYRFLFQ